MLKESALRNSVPVFVIGAVTVASKKVVVPGFALWSGAERVSVIVSASARGVDKSKAGDMANASKARGSLRMMDC